MLVITIANRKGGTDKTTTAVNLATQWGRDGLQTLLIDLDTQGHAAMGLGCTDLVDKHKTSHQLLRDNKTPLAQVVSDTAIDKVSIARTDTDFVVQEMAELRVRQGLYADGNELRCHRVVIDTPPTLDGLLYNGVLVPFVPHHLSAVGVN